MQTKISIALHSLAASIAGVTFCALIVFFFNTTLKASADGHIPQNQIVSNAVESIQNITPAAEASSTLPIRLKIPAINIDTRIEHLGLTTNGMIIVPDGPVDVAWFKLGPRPGEKGNSIIVGHMGWSNHKPAVFDSLKKLQAGDKIYIEGEKGEITVFVVRELHIYGEKENASDVFNSGDGKAHLNLITCGGAWDKIKRSYADRVVVFSDVIL